MVYRISTNQGIFAYPINISTKPGHGIRPGAQPTWAGPTGLILLSNMPPQSDRQPLHTFRLDRNSAKTEEGSPLVKTSAY